MLYEYKCPVCQAVVEEQRRVADRDAPSSYCYGNDEQPHNLAVRERQLARSGGFSLKGGGWYADGYARK